jgi:hypothetical protein
MPWERDAEPVSLGNGPDVAPDVKVFDAVKRRFGAKRVDGMACTDMVGVNQDTNQQVTLCTIVIVWLRGGKRKFAIYEWGTGELKPITYRQAHCQCGDEFCPARGFAQLEAQLARPDSPAPRGEGTPLQ